MNHLYRLVFNHALKTVQVVSEVVTGSRPGRAPSPAHARVASVRLLVAALALAASGATQAAAPVGWNEWRGSSINWYTASNWSSGTPTLAGQAAYIDNGRYAEVASGQAFSNHLHVGYSGDGRIGVLTGGRLRTGVIFMAHDAGASALAEIDGTGSTWRADSTIGVGHAGTGRVYITNGGTLDIGLESYVGATPVGNGLVLASGEGSRFLTGRTLLAGNEGTGVVRMQDHADMTSAMAYVGNTVSGNGRVELDGEGSTWSNTGDLYIGNQGTGVVDIRDGASVTTGASVLIGNQVVGTVRGKGTLLVDGVDSAFTGSGMMVVGRSGDGGVEVSNGGRVTLAGAITLGEQLRSTGTVRVSGAGSQLRSGSLRVGANADAQFIVEDGAFASIDGPIDIAYMGTSTSRLTIGSNAVLRVGNGVSGRISAGSGDAAVVMEGGTLQGNGALSVNAAVILRSTGTVHSDSDIDLWGRIAGAGQLLKTGTGTLALHGSNTHGGGMRVDAGRLVLGNEAAAGTGTLMLNDATALAFGSNRMTVTNAVRLQGVVDVGLAPGQAVTLSGAIDDGGSPGRLHKTGEGTLTLAAANSYSGGTHLDAGTLAVAATGAAGTGELLLAENTTLAFAADGVALGNAVVLDGRSQLQSEAGHARLTGVVRDGTGSGTLVKSGGGALALEAANIHTGGVQVQAGTLLLGDNTAGGSGSMSLADGTTLGVTRGNLDIANAIALQGDVTIVLDKGQDSRLSGTVGEAGSTGRLIKQGAGSLTLSASNGYSGGTSVASGTLKIEHSDALGSGAVQMSAGSALGLAGTALRLGNEVRLSGAVGVVAWPGTATLAGVVSDGGAHGALVKSGGGTLVLAAANSFSGGVQVTQGELALGNSAAAGSGTLTLGDFTRLGFTHSGLEIGNDVQLGQRVSVHVADAATLSGEISDATGNGRLLKSGAGTLTLSGSNSYSGGTQLNEGTLRATASNALGTGDLLMANGTTLSLAGHAVVLGNTLSLDGEGRIDVADGSARLDGVLKDGMASGGIIMMSSRPLPLSVTSAVPAAAPQAPGTLVKTGAGELVLSAASSYSGGTRIEAGRLRLQDHAVVTGDIQIAADAGLDLARLGDTRFAGVLSGAGQVRKLDAGQLWLDADSSAFSGQTRIDAGSLYVQGALGGSTTFSAGTLLAGTGTLGTVSLRDGATLAPGLDGQIGTLSIAGDLHFSQGARLLADVGADGRNDRVQVAGIAELGNAGTVAVARGSDWAPSTRYTLLTADRAVQGTFAGVSSNFAFLDPTLDYDANNVYLTMTRNDIAMPEVELAFPEVKVNSNQKEVAGAVEALGSGAVVYDAVVRLEVEQVAPAFDSLSGEIHAAHRGTLLRNRFLHDGIDRHLDGVATAAEIAPGVHAWVAGSGSQRRSDASAEHAGLRASQHGMMAGMGWRMGTALEVGVAAGQQQLDSRLALREARAETDTTEYGVYGQYRWQGLNVRAGVTRADHRTDSTRTAQVGSTLSEVLATREDATGTTAFLRAGWTFGGPRLQWTPEVELAQVRLRADGGQERGGHSALQLDAANARYRTGLAALRADWDISAGQRDGAALTARVGWQVAGGDRLPLAHARFVEGDQAFVISGAPLARRSALAQLGVAVSPTEQSRVSLQVQARRGDEQRELGAQLDWSVAF